MEIVVLGHKIDTKDIYDIIDIEKNKKAFLNREAGFIIKLIDKPDVVVGEKIPYERTPRQIAEVKDKWEKLQEQVTEQWKQDMTEFKIFTL